MIDRYLAIVTWARRRYTQKGFLIAYIGATPSRYTLIERAAWARYMAVDRKAKVAAPRAKLIDVMRVRTFELTGPQGSHRPQQAAPAAGPGQAAHELSDEQKAAAFDALWEKCGSGPGQLKDWISRDISRPGCPPNEATIRRVPRYSFEILAEGNMLRFRDVLHHLATQGAGSAMLAAAAAPQQAAPATFKWPDFMDPKQGPKG